MNRRVWRATYSPWGRKESDIKTIFGASPVAQMVKNLPAIRRRPGLIPRLKQMGEESELNCLWWVWRCRQGRVVAL